MFGATTVCVFLEKKQIGSWSKNMVICFVLLLCTD